jgi:uncharacterized protein (TIGR03437 family)
VKRIVILLAVLVVLPCRAETSPPRQAPSYTEASIVNGASYEPGAVAANTFITIWGRNLAYITRGLSPGDIANGKLPTALPGAGVRVWIGGIAAFLYYVSPQQVNVLAPSNLSPGTTEIQVQLDSIWGPPIPLTILPAAPALFQVQAGEAIAAHADGSVATADSPARPGEIIVLYATGLGDTTPRIGYGEIPAGLAWLANMKKFHVLIEGVEIPSSHVLYAGAAPGFGGLYQVNLRLPDDTPRNPRIQLSVDGRRSPDQVRIPVEP